MIVEKPSGNNPKIIEARKRWRGQPQWWRKIKYGAQKEVLPWWSYIYVN